MSNALAALNLPSAIHAQADKLLQAIRSSPTAPDTLRAIDRAEGFTLGVETLVRCGPIRLKGCIWRLMTRPKHG